MLTLFMKRGFTMLTLDEIGQSVRNNIQLVIDHFGLPLAVGPICDDDYKILAGGFGELAWDCGLSSYGNHPDRYEFCIKLVTQNGVQSIPSGAALCVYDVESRIFCIHMIENFERDDQEHPLTGRMALISIMSAIIFCKAVDGQAVHIDDPVPELHNYYSSFGFMMMPCGGRMEAEVGNLLGVFEQFS